MPLTGFARKYVRDLDDAKSIVHDVFVILWEKYPTLPADTNFKSYLFTSVKNRCLNHIRDRKKFMTLESAHENIGADDKDDLAAVELETQIEVALNTMPAKCREAFELSRVKGLKYAEIADQMGISVKTVEAHITKALGILRDHLGKFVSVLLILVNVVLVIIINSAPTERLLQYIFFLDKGMSSLMCYRLINYYFG